MTNYDELRELAEKAGGSKWYFTGGGDFQEVRNGPDASFPVMVWDGSRQDVDGDWIDSPYVKYIAEANPETILGLLDRIAELEQEVVQVASDAWVTCAQWHEDYYVQHKKMPLFDEAVFANPYEGE